MAHVLILSHDKIFGKAELLTSYQAAKDGTDFDACRIKKADRELIDSYYDEAVNELTQYLLHYIVRSDECKCIEIEQDDWVVALDFSNKPPYLDKHFDSLAHDVAATYVVGKWLAMLMSKQEAGSFEAATLMAQQHQTAVEQLKHCLNERCKPIRLRQQPF